MARPPLLALREATVRFDGRPTFSGVSVALGTGDRVGVMLPNSVDYVAVGYAIAKSGLVMVPLNYRFTGTDLAYHLRDAQAKARSGALFGAELLTDVQSSLSALEVDGVEDRTLAIGAGQGADLTPFAAPLGAFHTALEAAAAGRARPLSWQALLGGGLAEKAGKFRFVLALVSPRIQGFYAHVCAGQ